MELVERKRKILNRVVVKFIEKAEPVSSQEVSKNLDLECSILI